MKLDAPKINVTFEGNLELSIKRKKSVYDVSEMYDVPEQINLNWIDK